MAVIDQSDVLGDQTGGFPMVSVSEFRIWQYGDGDHREDGPHFSHQVHHSYP